MPLTDADIFAAGSLLGSVKSGVRNTSIAITETSSPHIRNVLIKQLSQEIHAHARIFNYMLARGLYPSYHLDQMIQNDLNNAQKVLSIPVQ
ncbi:spore coat protein [Paenibacillus sp. P25]|nr:spore coat protein [Paenibacillus sp. P25]